MRAGAGAGTGMATMSTVSAGSMRQTTRRHRNKSHRSSGGRDQVKIHELEITA